jgi:GNAT superfamily N-acetyltransferase
MSVEDLPRCFEVRTRTRENALTIEQLNNWYGLRPDQVPPGFADTLRGWVYEHDGEIVGFTMGDSSTGELTVIALLPDHEGQGIGSKLISAVTRWLVEGGKQPWLLTAADPSLRAYGFYRSQGWHATGDINKHNEERFVFSPA